MDLDVRGDDAARLRVARDLDVEMKMSIRQILFAAALALALAVPAQAQQTRPGAGLSPRGQLTLTVPSGSSSAATALPTTAAGGSVLFLHNNGAYPIRFNLGGGTVQASATTSYLMTAGECTAYALSDGQTYIAAWGIGGASSLEVT
jgi:hypothetical protein